MSQVAIERRAYGTLKNGASIDEYILMNMGGMEVRIITLGGIITSVRVPDRDGNFANVALGFDNLAGYETRHPYFGSITGRFANRIARGLFTLDGVQYTLATNNGRNHLHGGIEGFDKRVWAAQASTDGDAARLTMTYRSPDGEEGYPGTLDSTVTYTLNNAHELRIDYHAVVTDKPTVLNLTNHSYFNLKGTGTGDITGHILMLNADYFVAVDAEAIPTGELAAVDGTPFDFRKGKTIGADLRSTHQQVVYGRGFDHNWVLNRNGVAAGELAFAARAYDPVTGRTMEVLTAEPGIQFYSGNFLDATIMGSGGIVRQGDGFALETQHFPDSPNQPNFPSVVLRPGETYQTVTVFRFGTD